jgi:hypothetical protein
MKEIKTLPVWLLWKKEIRNGMPTKVPYKSPGVLASSTDPTTWNTYNNLLDRYYKTTKPGTEKGIGIVFEDTANIIGIDFDKCVVDGVLNSSVEEFVSAANTYVEYSPSGTGIHLLFQKTEAVELLTNKHHFDTYSIEVYTNGRYFTFTENEHELSKPLRKVTSDDLTALLEMLGYPWGKVVEVISPATPTNLNDAQLLEKMFASKNGSKVQRLWDGDTSDHSNDYSSADHALCMHLAFWTGKNIEQIERLWLQSPLGQREKTQKRADYRQRTITSAVNVTSDVYTPPTPHVTNGEDETDYDFILGGGSDKKPPYPQLIFPNIIRVLRKCPHFAGKIRKNDFSHFVEVKGRGNTWESLNDDFISQTREYIAENFPAFIKLNKDMTTDAIIRVASDTCVNPPRDYFTSLVWDKQPRLNSWLHNAYGTPDDALHQAIGSNWLKGLVKRVMQPGCQFDEVLALESPQGYRKSTSLRVLGAPWHVETTHSLDNKDFYLLLAQNIIVEFSEGEIMDRASVNKLKAEITKTEDQLRPPYERGMVKFQRSCVFAVTTNRLELKDDTGNRRWLPVQLNKVADIDWLADNKDQLYAEAYHRVIILGETTHEYPDELRDLQDSRREYDEGEEKLLTYLAQLSDIDLENNGMTLERACHAVYGEDYRANKLDELRVSSMMRRVGMVNERRYVGKQRVRRWFPNEKAIQTLQAIKQHNNDF